MIPVIKDNQIITYFRFSPILMIYKIIIKKIRKSYLNFFINVIINVYNFLIFC